MDGILIVDYLSELHGYIQHALLDSKYLLEHPIGIVEDTVFTYNSLDEISKMFHICGLFMPAAYGTDGITRFLAKDINQFSEEQLEKWMDFLWENCQSSGLLDYSEHCLAIGHKVKCSGQ